MPIFKSGKDTGKQCLCIYKRSNPRIPTELGMRGFMFVESLPNPGNTDIIIIRSFRKSRRNDGTAHTQKDKSNTLCKSGLRDVDPYQSSKPGIESTWICRQSKGAWDSFFLARFAELCHDCFGNNSRTVRLISPAQRTKKNCRKFRRIMCTCCERFWDGGT